MTRRQKGCMLAALVLLGAGFGLLRYLASRPTTPAMAPALLQMRQPCSPRRRRRRGASLTAPLPLDFALPDLHGHTLRLSDLHGKVVLLNFWATWCYPCRVEMPSMQALYQDYRKKNFEILAISIDVQGAEVVAPFVAASGLTFPVLLDPANTVSPQLLGRGIPTSYVLDKHGQTVVGDDVLEGRRLLVSAEWTLLGDGELLAPGRRTPYWSPLASGRKTMALLAAMSPPFSATQCSMSAHCMLHWERYQGLCACSQRIGTPCMLSAPEPVPPTPSAARRPCRILPSPIYTATWCSCRRCRPGGVHQSISGPPGARPASRQCPPSSGAMTDSMPAAWRFWRSASMR